MRFTHILPLLLFSIILAFSLVKLMENNDNTPKSHMVGKALPEINLPIALEKNKTLSLDYLRGQYFLINIFASWCITCKIEHPYLMAIKNQNIIPIYGIAWKDTPDALKKLLNETANPYKAILNDVNGTSIVALGVSGAPETFLISPEGKIAFHSVGPITDEIFKRDILPLIGAK